MKIIIEDNGDLVFRDSMVGTYVCALVLILVGFLGAIYYVIDSYRMDQSSKIILLFSAITLPLLIYGIKQRVGSSCRFRATDKIFLYEIRDYLRRRKGELPIEEIKELFVDEKWIESQFNESIYRLAVKNGSERIPLYIRYLNKEKHQDVTEKLNSWLRLNSLPEIVQV